MATNSSTFPSLLPSSSSSSSISISPSSSSNVLADNGTTVGVHPLHDKDDDVHDDNLLNWDSSSSNSSSSLQHRPSPPSIAMVSGGGLKEREALQSLKQSLGKRGTLREKDSDEDMLRFLAARSYDLDKATAMYEAMVGWRRVIGADTIIETFRLANLEAVKEMYPQFHHQTDKMGRPIYVERYGKLQMDNLLKLATVEDLLLNHVREWEILIHRKFPACSRAAGKPISQSLTILDLQGVTYRHLSSQVRHFIHKISKIDQDYYPERLGLMLIINAPVAFKGLWKFVKPWLEKNTQRKIEVHGSNFAPRLFELVEPHNLPEFLGGSCRCPIGCHKSDAGPWQLQDNGIA